MNDDNGSSKGIRNAVANTGKDKIAIRLDPEVIDWLCGQVEDADYQELINDVLKRHIDQ